MKKYFQSSYAGNIPRLYLHSAFTNFLLLFPIWVIFLQRERGLTLTEVTLVDAAFWLTMAAAEIPTGVVADVVGRKQSLLLHVLLAGIAILLFALAPTFPMLMIANSLWAVALTFNSGAGLSLLYDSLLQMGREGEYTKIRGRLLAIYTAAIGIAGALGGLIGAKNIYLPFWITGGVTLFALVFVLTMKEPPFEPDEGTGERVKYRQAIQITIKSLQREPNLRFVMAYGSLLPMGAMMVQVMFIQPHALNIGVPIAAIGFLIFGLRGISMVGAANAERTRITLGLWRSLVLAAIFVFVGLIGLGLVGSWGGILVFGVTMFATAAVHPLTEEIILRYTPGAVRATVLSVASMFFRLSASLVEPWFGLLGDRYGLPSMFMILAAISLAGLTAVLLLWRRTWDLGTIPASGESS